jgi:hypothetical protein
MEAIVPLPYIRTCARGARAIADRLGTNQVRAGWLCRLAAMPAPRS